MNWPMEKEIFVLKQYVSIDFQMSVSDVNPLVISVWHKKEWIAFCFFFLFILFFFLVVMLHVFIFEKKKKFLLVCFVFCLIDANMKEKVSGQASVKKILYIFFFLAKGEYALSLEVWYCYIWMISIWKVYLLLGTKE